MQQLVNADPRIILSMDDGQRSGLKSDKAKARVGPVRRVIPSHADGDVVQMSAQAVAKQGTK